ncbi:hypothetical protein HDV63DRAFT_399862 [Trichoderma sp. SZMC 28014]
MPNEANRLMKGIAEKAKAVFLWVSVVVHLLREGLTEGDSLRHLQNMLDALPSDISDLYKSMWKGIKPQYIGHASRLFQYTLTDDSLHNSFIGLCAQFGVLQYVREKIAGQPDLLNLLAKTHSVLACAIFGPENFRPARHP